VERLAVTVSTIVDTDIIGKRSLNLQSGAVRPRSVARAARLGSTGSLCACARRQPTPRGNFRGAGGGRLLGLA
jgi:hypothetical protein